MFKKIFSILFAICFCMSSVAALADSKGLAKGKTNEEVVATEIENEQGEVEDEGEQNTIGDTGKTIKEQLEAKKEERASARLDAKVFIKDLHTMFKDADEETKKDILSEIAEVKKELKSLSIGVFVKGLVVDFAKYDNVEPVIENGRTLAPVRAITEALGAEVIWNSETGKISITKGDVSIVLTIDSEIAIVNGKEVTLDVSPKIVNNRTLVPMRFISEALNLGVNWDENSRTVIVEEKPAEVTPEPKPVETTNTNVYEPDSFDYEGNHADYFDDQYSDDNYYEDQYSDSGNDSFE